MNAFTVQGVHLLLRAGARRRPAARGRRRRRPGHLVGHPGRRRRRGAWRDPRGDRHARGRPDGHGPRPVRPGRSSATARSARPVLGTRRVDRDDRPGRHQRLLPPPLPPAGHGGRGRRQRRPRHRRAAGPQGVRRRRACCDGDVGARGAARGGQRSRTAAAACASSARTTEQANVVLGGPGVRPHRRAALRARRAQRRARRRHVVAGCSRRSARSAGWPTRSTATTRSTPTPGCSASTPGCVPAQGRRRAGDLPRRARPRSPRPASPPRSSQRGKGQLRGSLVLGLEDTGSRMSRIGKAELVYGELLSVDEVLGPDRRASRLDDVREVAADVLRRDRRRSRSSARSTRTATSPPSAVA